MSLCIRHVDDNLSIYQDVLGLYETSKTDAAKLTSIIQDVFLRLNLPIENLRAQCYDSASNMSGRHTAVLTRILQLQPKALYAHCRNHVLDLALQDSASAICAVRDALSLTNDLSTFFRDSAKRTGVLELVIKDVCCSSSAVILHPLTPTRWTIRARALNALVQHHEAIAVALGQLADEPGSTGSKAAGFLSKLSTFECLFGLTVAHKIFSVTEQLNTLLQSSSLTLSAARESISIIALLFKR